MRQYRVVPYRGKWAAEYTDPATGQRRRRSLGTDVQGDVEQRLDRLDAELEAESRPAVITIAYAWDGKIASLGERPGAKSMSWSWKAIGAFWGHLPADSVTEELCDGYVAQRRSQGVRDGTIWLELSRLRAALRWAEKKNLIAKAPFVWKPSAPKPRDKRLTRQEAARFLAACDAPHLRLFVTLALTTAARSEAILGLTWDRVDRESRRIDFRDPEKAETTKGRSVVPMNDTAAAALSLAHAKASTPYLIEWQGERIRNIKMGLRKAGERCGLTWVSAHVFRHTAASWMAEADIPLFKIAKYLGHRDTKMVERVYAHLSPSYLSSASDALELDANIRTIDTDTVNQRDTKQTRNEAKEKQKR